MDALLGTGCLGIVGLGVLLVGGFVWLMVTDKLNSQRANADIHASAAALAAQREAEAQAQAIAGLWLHVKEQFPFLPTPAVEDTEAETLQAAILGVIADWPTLGTIVGVGAPAPELPPKARQKHLYVVGKTGSGKSTYLEHLIAENLRSDHGLAIVSPERGFFREHLLPCVPRNRHRDVVYFAPGDSENTLTLNPLSVEGGHDPVRAAEDLFTIFKRSMGDTAIGPRMDPILQNAFAALVGSGGRTFWDVKRIMEDELFRDEVLREGADPYVADFWRTTYPSYASGSHLPILSRLDRFLRPPAIRQSLCSPVSSISLREAISKNRILFCDLSGLGEGSRLRIGQILLAKLQLELMRTERRAGSPYFLYADDFQTFAGVAEGTWRELLSRGRKFGVALTLAHQYPSQLPKALQDEIFGNVNSLAVFRLGNKDAQVARRDLLRKTVVSGEEKVRPIDASEILELGVGAAMCKYAGGRAVQVQFPPPLTIADPSHPDEIIAKSRKRYGLEELPEVEPLAEPAYAATDPEDFLE